jgi:hypothetical protein
VNSDAIGPQTEDSVLATSVINLRKFTPKEVEDFSHSVGLALRNVGETLMQGEPPQDWWEEAVERFCAGISGSPDAFASIVRSPRTPLHPSQRNTEEDYAKAKAAPPAPAIPTPTHLKLPFAYIAGAPASKAKAAPAWVKFADIVGVPATQAKASPAWVGYGPPPTVLAPEPPADPIQEWTWHVEGQEEAKTESEEDSQPDEPGLSSRSPDSLHDTGAIVIALSGQGSSSRDRTLSTQIESADSSSNPSSEEPAGAEEDGPPEDAPQEDGFYEALGLYTEAGSLHVDAITASFVGDRGRNPGFHGLFADGAFWRRPSGMSPLDLSSPESAVESPNGSGLLHFQ